MEEVGTDQTCQRCGEIIDIAVVNTGNEPVSDPLDCLLGTRSNDRRILVARCSCDPPRIVGLTGAPVFETEFDIIEQNTE